MGCSKHAFDNEAGNLLPVLVTFFNEIVRRTCYYFYSPQR
jgi:hypothetical protein